MVKTLATDGVEWLAADMTHDQSGIRQAITDRTQLWAGTSGVFYGGVVAVVSGLTVSVSGPLAFHANGELGEITSPGNWVMADDATNYVIAHYTEALTHPASFYSGIGPTPDLYYDAAPEIIVRTSAAAVEASGEVNLATVVTASGSISSHTDTRRLLPYFNTGARDIVLGPGGTIDGVDPSVIAPGPGGSTPYYTLGGAWAHDMFLGTGSESVPLDDGSFSSPQHMFRPTRFGDLDFSMFSLKVMNRFTLTFHSDTIQSVTVQLVLWDDNVRLKANGTTLFSQSTAGDYNTSGSSQMFSTVIGTNTIQVYQGNMNSGDLGCCMVECGVLSQSGIKFTG